MERDETYQATEEINQIALKLRAMKLDSHTPGDCHLTHTQGG